MALRIRDRSPRTWAGATFETTIDLPSGSASSRAFLDRVLHKSEEIDLLKAQRRARLDPR